MARQRRRSAAAASAALRWSWPLWWLLTANSWTPSDAFFFWLFAGKCASSADRCFFGFAYSMYSGVPGTENCVTICSLFPIFAPADYNCGQCNPPAPGPPPSNAPRNDVDAFFIDLDLNDVPLEDRSFYYREAAETWTEVITAGLPDVAASQIPENLWPVAPCTLPNGDIDDVYVCIDLKKFDRRNENVVASASPVFARAAEAGGLPLTGIVTVNQDRVTDLKNGNIYQDTIRHELAHVLGLGSMWGQRSLTSQVVVGSSTKCYYAGARANQEYQALSGCGSNTILLGASCGHWDEICFGNEIFTDTIGTYTFLSRITIAAFEDLGYQVDYSGADAVSKYDLAFTCRCGIRRLEDSHLGLFENTSQPHSPRRLSDNGYQTAFNYGQSLLDKQEELIDSLGGRTELPEDIVFVGDRAVNVLYIEGGTVYSVTVVRQSVFED